jgi:DNA mismatch endonuclease (patch repair protein)
MDVVSRHTRSRMMASIRGSNTKPERIVRSLLHSCGFRFRLHRKDLPGRPDIVLPRYGLAILVHGCFWHRHADCRYAYSPRSNRRFWSKRLSDNAKRDERVLSSLHSLGWRTLIVWECHLKGDTTVSALARELARAVRSNVPHAEIPKRALC